jgi:hypothetical protein
MTEGRANPIKPKFMYIMFENSLFTTQCSDSADILGSDLKA